MKNPNYRGDGVRKVASATTRKALDVVVLKASDPQPDQIKKREKSSADLRSSAAERASNRLTDAGHQLREGTGSRVGSKEEMQDAHKRAAEAHRAAAAAHYKVANTIAMKGGIYSGTREEQDEHSEAGDYHSQQAERHEKQAESSEWDESKHPRDEQGRFT